MLKKFRIKNYKNFQQSLEVDFSKVGGYKFNTDCVTNDLLSKIIIYGRNATGKTNLGSALGDITRILRGYGRASLNDIRTTNANSSEEQTNYFYNFVFGKDEVIYEYSRDSSGELISEELLINGEYIFQIFFAEYQFNILSLEKVGAESIQTKKYLDTLGQDYSENDFEHSFTDRKIIPFLRYILNNTALLPQCALRQMEDFINRMGMLTVQNVGIREVHFFQNSFVDYLSTGNNLQHFELFLNNMGVECSLTIINSADGEKSLYFDYERPVPFFQTASSGTIALTNFYRRFIAFSGTPSLMYLDEFDAFYHYEMAESLVRYFKKYYSNCQIIMTTHNTNLMTNHLMRPDSLLILSRDGRLTALCDATERELREGHNLEKLYIGGEFEKYE